MNVNPYTAQSKVITMTLTKFNDLTPTQQNIACCHMFDLQKVASLPKKLHWQYPIYVLRDIDKVFNPDLYFEFYVTPTQKIVTTCKRNPSSKQSQP